MAFSEYLNFIIIIFHNLWFYNMELFEVRVLFEEGSFSRKYNIFVLEIVWQFSWPVFDESFDQVFRWGFLTSLFDELFDEFFDDFYDKFFDDFYDKFLDALDFDIFNVVLTQQTLCLQQLVLI